MKKNYIINKLLSDKQIKDINIKNEIDEKILERVEKITKVLIKNECKKLNVDYDSLTENYTLKNSLEQIYRNTTATMIAYFLLGVPITFQGILTLFYTNFNNIISIIIILLGVYFNYIAFKSYRIRNIIFNNLKKLNHIV